MAPIDRLAEDLTDEAMKEAADTFFGKRRKLEEEIELFKNKTEELKDKARDIKRLVSLINSLLLREHHSRMFWQIFGAEDLSSVQEEPAPTEADITLPFALRPFSRYYRFLTVLYRATAEAVQVYNHGKYIQHPDVPGKKVVTISYSYLNRWLEQLNTRIDRLNYYHKSSDVLQFAKRMDVQQAVKERIAGADLTYSLDEDLKMDALDLADYDIPIFPDLPELSAGLKKRIKKAAARVYSKNKNEVRARLKQIADEGKTG
ncbi:MAG: hypothetical protein ACLFSY_10815 [Desulfonatronovibrionaceae bacterium]